MDYKGQKRFWKILITISILIAVIMTIMFEYIDLKSLTIWSTNILDCIADGDITKYFSFSALNLHNLTHGYVSGTLYSLIIWSVWNVPIWILQRFFAVEITTSSLSLIWSKLFLVLLLCITLIYTYKLIMHLINDKKIAKLTVFLCFSFIFTYVGVFYTGQNDIFICAFGIMALYYLIKNGKQKNILFYLLSGLAISVKYFFFIPYVLIILLMEKNILKIILKIIIGLIPVILFNLACYNLPMFIESGAVRSGSSMLNVLFGGSFLGAYGGVSLFLLAYVILAFIAYIVKPKDNIDLAKYIIYFTAASLMCVIVFTNQEFYRSILLMPFIFVLFAMNKKNMRINIILEIIMSISLVVLSFSNYYFFNAETINNSLLVTILNLKNSIESISPFSISTKFFSDYMPIIGNVFGTILIAVSIIILYINYPKSKFDLGKENSEIEKYILVFRTVMIIPFLLLMLYVCFR